MSNPARLAFALALALLCPTAVSAAERTARGHGHPRRSRHARLEFPAARTGRAGAVPIPPKPERLRLTPAQSIGSPNDGRLEGGVHIDLTKPYLHVVPSFESGDVRWGHPELVNMIDRAARIVAKRFPSSVLPVGDLSKKGGGDLLRHHSHESGRDADLGFYVVDTRGKQVHSHGFVKFDPNLSSPANPGARFDLPRNWAFVQELLSDPVARVSHIFVAEYLRRELLGYARPRVSRALYDRAALVLMQPHNSLPHDDHFHVRISCPHEAHSGCIELARNAPHGSPRVAHRGDTVHVLRTPHARPRVLAVRPPRAPAAAAVAPQEPVVLPSAPGPDDLESEVEVD